jgi:hypothetical protein
MGVEAKGKELMIVDKKRLGIVQCPAAIEERRKAGS